jgi:hypothetical protein
VQVVEMKDAQPEGMLCQVGRGRRDVYINSRHDMPDGCGAWVADEQE